MKKLSTLALAAAFTVGAAPSASAVDIKLDGEMMYQFQTASEGFSGGNTEFIGYRTRLGISMAASDRLSSYVQFQIGENLWGMADEHGAQEEQEIFARQMYLDWSIPGTEAKVRMGRHAFSMPGFVSCSPVITDYVGEGVVLDLPIGDSFGLTSFWTRAASDAGSTDVNGKDFDVFGLVGRARFDDVKAVPWIIYGSKKAGAHGDYESQSTILSDAAADVVILGTSFEWKAFDPMTLALDAAWGKVKYGSGEEQDDKGWYVAAGCTYALDFAEPSLKAWYASGDKEGRRANSGSLPSIFGDSYASNMFFDGASGILGGHRVHIGGTWGVSAQLNGLSFCENLTHDLSVTYFGGTNNKNNVGEAYSSGYDYLTGKDRALEFAAVNKVEIYKGLTAYLEAAYIIEDFDTSTGARRGEQFENDWRLSMTFGYTF